MLEEFVKMKSLVGSPGGKILLKDRIIRYIPEHKVYIELFFGGGQVFFHKKPSEKEVINDLDPGISFLHRFARDYTERDYGELKRYNWSFSKNLFEKLKDSKPESDTAKFRKLFYLKFWSFNSGGSSPGLSKGRRTAILSKLPKIKERLKDTIIRNQD